MYCDDDKGDTDLYGAIRIHAEILSTLKMSQKLSENEQELRKGQKRKKIKAVFWCTGKVRRVLVFAGEFLSSLCSSSRLTKAVMALLAGLLLIQMFIICNSRVVCVQGSGSGQHGGNSRRVTSDPDVHHM